MEAIQNFLQTVLLMQWSDYLDIALVAFLVYKMLPLLRTPNIMRIARTVIALVLAFFGRSLLVVALGASGAALLCELVMRLF